VKDQPDFCGAFVHPLHVEAGPAEFRQLAHRLAAQSRQGCVALNGEILLNVDGETVLIH
jgi:hypothetical protein